jgi:hypothetical protein
MPLHPYKEHVMSVYYYDVLISAAPSPALPPITREQRLRDGSLVDLSRIACEAGFTAPVAISKEALHLCLAGLPDVAHDATHDSVHGPCSPCLAAKRLWPIVWAAAAEVTHHQEDKAVFFSARLDPDDAGTTPASEAHLKLVIDAGTTDRPVVTILLPDQE